MGWGSGRGKTYPTKIVIDMYKGLTLPEGQHSGPRVVCILKGKRYSAPVSKEVAIEYLTEHWKFQSEGACHSYLKQNGVKELPSTWQTDGKYKPKN